MTPTKVHPRPWLGLGPEVATALGQQLDEVVRQLAEGIAASVPEFATIDDPRFARDTVEAVTAALERFVSLVGADEPALSREIRETFVSLGAAEARENRGPNAVISALRVGARLLLSETTAAVRTVVPLTSEHVLQIADAVSAFTDELVAASTEGYAEQVREAAGESDRRRMHLAELLVRGGAAPSAVHQAAIEAGWDGLGAITPILLDLADAREARFRFSADGVVVERHGYAVVLVRDTGRPVADLLGARLSRRPAVVGLTVPWSEVPQAEHLAVRTADRVRQRDGTVLVAEHLVALAVNGEVAAAAALVTLRLAPILALPAGPRDALLQTLDSWLRNWGARTVVARELFVHPQTVSYRIRRVRELLGDGLDDPAVRFELAVALTHERTR